MVPSPLVATRELSSCAWDWGTALSSTVNAPCAFAGCGYEESLRVGTRHREERALLQRRDLFCGTETDLAVEEVGYKVGVGL